MRFPFGHGVQRALDVGDSPLERNEARTAVDPLLRLLYQMVMGHSKRRTSPGLNEVLVSLVQSFTASLIQESSSEGLHSG